MAKIPKIMRPEFELECKGFLGYIGAMYAIIKVGIRKMIIECCGKEYKTYIIPKYSLKSMKDD